MTSSTKPEVHSMFYCCQRSTVPGPQVTCIDNVVKFGHVVLRYESGQTDAQTDRQTGKQA